MKNNLAIMTLLCGVTLGSAGLWGQCVPPICDSNAIDTCGSLTKCEAFGSENGNCVSTSSYSDSYSDSDTCNPGGGPI